MPARSLVGSVALTLLLAGCAGRGSVEEDRVCDTLSAGWAAAFVFARSYSDLEVVARSVKLSVNEGFDRLASEVASDGGTGSTAPGEPEIDVYGRDAMVRWGGSTLFLARFDDGWRVTAAGCAPRGEDLPYDCAVEGR